MTGYVDDMLEGTMSWARLLGSVRYQGLPKKGFPPSIELIVGEVTKGAEEQTMPSRRHSNQRDWYCRTQGRQ